MKLTAEQQPALNEGTAIPVTIQGIPCVILREDVFGRVKQLLQADFDPEEAYPLIEAALGDDPGLESYQRYKARP